MAASSSPKYVIVMRHADRLDNCKHLGKLWLENAGKQWDPPLVPFFGPLHAMKAAGEILKLDFRVNRVIVSPFLRCIETAHSVLPKLKVDAPLLSIDGHLCEAMNNIAIRYPPVDPRNGFRFEFQSHGFSLKKKYGNLVPDNGVVELPRWEESFVKSKGRFKAAFQNLSNAHPNDNLLLITHGDGFETAFMKFPEKEDEAKVRPGYCAYVVLRKESNGDLVKIHSYLGHKEDSFLESKLRFLLELFLWLFLWLHVMWKKKILRRFPHHDD